MEQKNNIKKITSISITKQDGLYIPSSNLDLIDHFLQCLTLCLTQVSEQSFFNGKQCLESYQNAHIHNPFKKMFFQSIPPIWKQNCEKIKSLFSKTLIEALKTNDWISVEKHIREIFHVQLFIWISPNEEPPFLRYATDLHSKRLCGPPMLLSTSETLCTLPGVYMIYHKKNNHHLGWYSLWKPQKLWQQNGIFCNTCQKMVSKKEHTCKSPLLNLNKLNQSLATNSLTTKKLLFLDTETNGLPPKTMGIHHPNQYQMYDTARVIQVAWYQESPLFFKSLHQQSLPINSTNLFPLKPTKDILDEIKEYLIRPEGFYVSTESTGINGITHEKAMSQGIEWDVFATAFLTDLKQCDVIVGHNILFDIHVLLSECWRRNNVALAEEILSKSFICTMELATIICGIRSEQGFIKHPKLSEAFEYFYLHPPTASHQAKIDVYTCFLVWKKILPLIPVLPHASIEQQLIINHINQGDNVMVNAVAGSGKTTCILLAALAQPHQQFIIITYNRRLKDETQYKCTLLGLDNVSIYTYHGLAGKCYREQCHDDSDLSIIVKNGTKKTLRAFQVPDVIVIDECQDMNVLYYSLVHKWCFDFELKTHQWWIMGDHMQTICTYNNADCRYLTCASDLFLTNSQPWKLLHLKVSHRLTQPMAHLLNTYYLDQPYLCSYKPGELPFYLVVNFFQVETSARLIVQAIKDRLNQGFLPQDVFILAPSLRKDRLVQTIENILVKDYKIPCFVPNSDNTQIDGNVTKGKVLFSSFHQAKGLERPVLIVLQVDQGYETFFSKQKQLKLPNAMYVALTRAQSQLIMVHQQGNPHLSCFKTDKISLFTKDVHLILNNNNNKNKNDDGIFTIQPNNNLTMMADNNMLQQIKCSVTDLLRHVPYNILDEMMLGVTVCSHIKSPPPFVIQELPVYVNQGLIELISDVNGLTIPGYIEYQVSGKSSMIDYLKEHTNEFMKQFKNKKQLNTWNQIVTLYDQQKVIENELWSFVSLLYETAQQKYLHRLYQIHEWNWLTTEHLEQGLKVFHYYMDKQSSNHDFEIPIEAKITIPSKSNYIFQVNGRLDYLSSNDEIWEFKCIQKLSNIHFLQVILYLALKYKTTTQTNDQSTTQSTNQQDKYQTDLFGYVLNFYDGQVFIVSCKTDFALQVLYQILTYKYLFNNDNNQSDEDFIKEQQLVKLIYETPI